MNNCHLKLTFFALFDTYSDLKISIYQFFLYIINMKITLNPDKTIVEKIQAGLKAKDGYCPCRIQKTPENKCMCQEFRNQIKDPDFEGFCHCMLYYKSK